jgi:aminopeptidase N
MDEGINSYYELEFTLLKSAGEKPVNFHGYIPGAISEYTKLTNYQTFLLGYKTAAFDNSDQPIMTRAKDFTYLNYGTVLYSRTALALRFLEDYLGRVDFDRAMQLYFNSWKFRHPGPDD